MGTPINKSETPVFDAEKQKALYSDKVLTPTPNTPPLEDWQNNPTKGSQTPQPPLMGSAPQPPFFGKPSNTPPPKKVVYDKNKLEGDILGFLKGKTGRVKLNDYLKTLFPVSANQAGNIGDSRYIRSVLDKLDKENKITMYHNSHDRLGDTYYPNEGIQAAQYNLDTCSIEVE